MDNDTNQSYFNRKEFDFMLDTMIQKCVAEKKTPAKTLEQLSYMAEKKGDLEKILNHPNTPDSVFIRLCNNPDLKIRSVVAESTRCPEGVLRLMSDDIDESIRKRVASNKNTPEETLVILSLDNSKSVNYAVAHNPSACDVTIKFLQAKLNLKDGHLSETFKKRKSSIVKKAEKSLGKDWKNSISISSNKKNFSQEKSKGRKI